MQFLKTDPELNGTMLARSLGAFTNRTLMRLRAEYGLTNIQSHIWYPADMVIAFLRDLGRTGDGPYTLVSMGITLASRMPLPNNTPDIPAALLQLCELLYQSWRGGTPGDLTVEAPNPYRTRLTVNDTQLPADFLYGMVFGIAHRVGPKGIEPAIERTIHDTTLIFDIRWEVETAPLR